MSVCICNESMMKTKKQQIGMWLYALCNAVGCMITFYINLNFIFKHQMNNYAQQNAVHNVMVTQFWQHVTAFDLPPHDHMLFLDQNWYN